MRQEMSLTPGVVDDVVRVMRVLADPTRLRVVGLLRGRELNVTSLCELLCLAQPTVSHHLSLLRGVGLVRNRRDGKQIFYSLNASVVDLDDATGELTFGAGQVQIGLSKIEADQKAYVQTATTVGNGLRKGDLVTTG